MLFTPASKKKEINNMEQRETAYRKNQPPAEEEKETRWLYNNNIFLQ